MLIKLNSSRVKMLLFAIVNMLQTIVIVIIIIGRTYYLRIYFMHFNLNVSRRCYICYYSLMNNI
jgi:hypothetical protein